MSKAKLPLNEEEKLSEFNRWKETALENFEVAEVLFNLAKESDAIYYYQQAIEKTIKSITILISGELIREHDILKLVNNLEKNGFTLENIKKEDLLIFQGVNEFSRYPIDGLTPKERYSGVSHVYRKEALKFQEILQNLEKEILESNDEEQQDDGDGLGPRK